MKEPSSIRFWQQSVEDLMGAMSRQGGLMVFPSAPALCMAESDPLYWKAHVTADYALLDSGYLALLLRAIGRPANRISGLRFLQSFVQDPRCAYPVREKRILWVVPDTAEELRIRKLLLNHGFDESRQDFYLAPFYAGAEDFKDPALREHLERTQPECIVMCIGGGKQEQVGYFIREYYGTRAPIICTGAAIAFLSGGQANIPTWADRLYLGWFMRILQDPPRYLKRYASAVKMPLVLWKLR
jgi:N-acetylglucosaminyldiphosphoundecaprenol N-acetyl-beta-D-mannosaminyltransferase